MSAQPTFLHFYTSVIRFDHEGTLLTQPQAAYSWYLEQADGQLIKSSKHRWNSKEEVIADVTKNLGEGFWNTEHTVFQDDWFKLLVQDESEEAPPTEDDDLPPISAESYLLFDLLPPYGWYLKSPSGKVLDRSGRKWDNKKDVIENANYVLGGADDPSIFVVHLSWRNLIKSGAYMNIDESTPVTAVEEAIVAPETSEFTFDVMKSDFDVELVDSAGSDLTICHAARVSTLGAEAPGSKESEGLLNFLMSNRHGSPFEHGMMTFRITAPIMVWREFMRHRVGFSYNEQSGRYMELSPVFYCPPRGRNLVQEGKPGAYSFVPGTDGQYDLVERHMLLAYGRAWVSYKVMLDAGIAKEVARAVLPVATYSTAYVTCNPRSMMSFLSLRTMHPTSHFPSFPQWEISQVAEQMEDIFRELFPITHKTFTANGRVSP